MNQEELTDSLRKTQSPHLLDVSNKSKQIPTKVKNKSLAPKEASDSYKKYQTTKKKAKFELLDDIRRMVDPDFANENWCNTVLQFKPEEYKVFLKKLYPEIEACKIPAKWKKIKRTLNNMGKPDGRGGALFGNAKEKEELKKHIEYVIQNKMKTKCFEELRRNVVPKIQEMFERNGRKFSDKVFQKHFWSYFLNNPENDAIKKAWRLLKRTKPQKDVGDVSFFSDNVEILLNEGDESFLLEHLEEEEVDLKEEITKDFKDNIEISRLEEKDKGDDDIIELESIERFFDKSCLVEKKIENGKAFEGKNVFYAPFVSFDNELEEFFEKK